MINIYLASIYKVSLKDGFIIFIRCLKNSRLQFQAKIFLNILKLQKIIFLLKTQKKNIFLELKSAQIKKKYLKILSKF